MAAARRDFLSKGYYAALRDTLCTEILSRAGTAPVLLDTGCGEGYYTSGIYQALLRDGKTPRMAGIDISKFILRYASKREKAVEFAVASSYHLPVADSSIDILLNCFSPLALEEFQRVLKTGGYFLYVVPAAEHLWEMKQVLYDNPYPNAEEAVPYEGFDYVDIVPVTAAMEIRDQASLSALFRMTPYAWKTPKEGVERLNALSELDVTMDFRIHVFRKREE